MSRARERNANTRGAFHTEVYSVDRACLIALLGALKGALRAPRRWQLNDSFPPESHSAHNASLFRRSAALRTRFARPRENKLSIIANLRTRVTKNEILVNRHLTRACDMRLGHEPVSCLIQRHHRSNGR